MPAINHDEIVRAIKKKKLDFKRKTGKDKLEVKFRPRSNYPDRVEKSFYNDLKKFLIIPYANRVKEFKKMLPTLIEIEKKRFKTDSLQNFRLDADGPFRGLLYVHLFDDWNDAIIADIVETRFSEAETINADAIRDHFKSVLGVEPFIKGSYIGALQSSYVKQTVDLITTIRTGTQERVAHVIEKAVRTGQTTEDASQFIRMYLDKSVKNSAYRAKFIARDQIASYNSNLNELKSREIGINRYIWHHSRDERVRGNPNGRFPKAKPSHFHREKQIFSWDMPPAGGHPGQDFNCRCWAESDLTSIDDE